MKYLTYFAFALLLSGVTAMASEPLVVGEPAPEFELQDQNGQLHSLEDYREQWVVLYFYPKDDTPGCTTEACEFRDNIFAFKAINAQILGVSLDDVESHQKFAEKHGLPFILLSDPDHSVARAYGAWGAKSSFGKTYEGIIRSHFAIDEEGRLMEFKLKVKPEKTAYLALKLTRL